MNFPLRNQAPDHKLIHFISRLIQVSTKEFEPSSNLSSDEKDARFQRHHEDKHRVNFKREGDVFLIDAFCEDGYTINFYLRNPPRQIIGLKRGTHQLTPKFLLC